MSDKVACCCRCSVGVKLFAFLNERQKLDLLLNPHCFEMTSIVESVVANRWAACSIQTSLSSNLNPVFSNRNLRFKVLTDMLKCLAIL